MIIILIIKIGKKDRSTRKRMVEVEKKYWLARHFN